MCVCVCYITSHVVRRCLQVAIGSGGDDRPRVDAGIRVELVMLLLLALVVVLLLRLTAKPLLVDACTGCLEHLGVDDHHHATRQVEGTDGGEDRVAEILHRST